MNAVIVYESICGNTKNVAEAIAAELEAAGNATEIRSVRQRFPKPPRGAILFLGSPVRMGSVAGRVKRFVDTLDVQAWKDRPTLPPRGSARSLPHWCENGSSECLMRSPC